MAGIECDTVAAPEQVQDPCPPSGLLRTLNARLGVCDREDVILEDIKGYLNWDKNADLDVMDEFGDTALMRACLWGKLSIVCFLLEKGANPNLSNVTGETALHFACSYRKCNPLARETVTTDSYLHITCSGSCDLGYEYPPYTPEDKDEQKAQAREEDEKAVEMFKLLLKYNAIIHLNHDGMSPVDYAALQGKEETVDYIISYVALSKLEELNALEILAFALSVKDKFSEAYRVLVKTMKKRNPDSPISMNITSQLESLLGQKEYQTLEDILKAIKTRKHHLTGETILRGDRVLSESTKSCHVYDRVANFGLNLLFDSDTVEQGLSILLHFLQYEQEGLVRIGYVLELLTRIIFNTCMYKDMIQFLSSVCKTLKAYVNFLKEIDSARLDKTMPDLMQSLSQILFDVTKGLLGQGLFSSKVLDDVLVHITDMINVIRSKDLNPEEMPDGTCILNTVSVSHGLLRLMTMEFTFLSDRKLGKDAYYSFKPILIHLLPVEGALDVDGSGNTMLHTAMSFPVVIDHDPRDTLKLHELRVDLIRLLIRHGCPTKTKNKKGERPDIMFMKILPRYHLDSRDNDIMKQEVFRLLEVPTEVLPLQELTVRTILYHRIPYDDKIPPRLKRLIIEPFPE